MNKLLAALFGKNGRHSQSQSENGLPEISGRAHFLQMIELERHRVNRDNRQFSLILFHVDPHGDLEPSIGKLASLIRKRVRRIDLVGWFDNGHIGVLLPNTSAAGARRVSKIIAENLCGILHVPPGSMPFRTFSYPDSSNPEQQRP